MKTFEEKLTAWLDGVLDGDELRSFEREHPELQQEKAEFVKLQRLLRHAGYRPQLPNPDFFNSQIMAGIRQRDGAESRTKTLSWFGLPRMAWGGLGVLSVGFALFFALIPRNDYSDPRAKYVAEVLKTKTADPKVKETVDNEKNMTAIKLESLEKLPPGRDPHH